MKYEDFWFDINGHQEPYEDAMIIYLMQQSVLTSSCQEYTDCTGRKSRTLVLFVLVNDMFGPGADGEDVTLEELPKLFELHWKHGWKGTMKFVADKRGIHYEIMKEN